MSRSGDTILGDATAPSDRWLRRIWNRLPLTVRRTEQQLVSTGRRTVRLLRLLWLPLLIGIVVRAVLIPISFDGDLATYAEAAASMSYGQPLYSYSFIYPPMWGLYLNALGHVVALFAPPTTWLSTNPTLQGMYATTYTLVPPYSVNLSFVVLEKCSLVVFDLLSGLLIYGLASRITGREATGRLAFALWFLNPLTILVSSLHGAFAVIPTFCVLAALVLCFEKSYGFSGALIGMGTLFKLFPIFFAPMLIAITWRNSRSASGRPYRSVGGFVVGLLVVSAPVLAGPGLLTGYLSTVFAPIGGNTLSYGGLGFWGIFSAPSLRFVLTDVAKQSSLTTFVVAALAGVISVAVGFMLSRGPPLDWAVETRWLWGSLATAACGYLLTPFGQPQYQIWILPFALLLALGNRLFMGIFWVITIVSALVYLLFIGGPLFFFLPLWYDFHVLSAQAYIGSVTYWRASFIPTYGPWVGEIDACALFLALGISLWRVVRWKPIRPRGGGA